MNILQIDGNIEKTQDCKDILNNLIGVKNWKRLYKSGTLRCFTNDDKEFVTIAEDAEGEYQAFIDINIENEIKAIKNISKFYYTCDYGEMYYNPYTKTLHIVGGDGGYMYSKTKPTQDEIESGDHSSFKEFNTHPETSFIKEVVWADEYFPEDKGFISLGSIKLFDY